MMFDKNKFDKNDQLAEIDDILVDIREHLDYSKEQGEIYELRALQLLLQVTRALHSQHNIYALMTMVLDSALSFAEAERAFLMLADDEDGLRFKMGRSYAGQYLTQEDFTISTSAVEDAVAGREPLIVVDAQSDEEFNKRQSIVNLSLRTVMAAPLVTRDDDVLGLIYVDSTRPLARYSKHHLNVMTSLAEQAAVALINARKFETQTG